MTLLSPLFCILLATSPIVAANVTWTNSSQNNQLSSGTNWNTGTTPTSLDLCIFGTVSGSATPAGTNSSFNVAGLEFTGSVSYTFSLYDSVMSFGSLTFLTAGTQTFNLDYGSDTTFSGSVNTNLSVFNLTEGSALYWTDSTTAGHSTVSGTNSSLFFSGSASAGTASISMSGTSGINFSDSATAGGATFTLSQTSLGFTDSSSGGTANLTLTSASSLFFDNTTTNSLGSLNTSSNSSVSLLNVALTIGNNTTNSTIAGSCLQIGTSPSSLIKIGSSTLTFQTAATYTGSTTIQGGKITLTGSGSLASTSALSVGNNTTFDCSGITANSLTLGDLSGGSGTVHFGAKKFTVGTSNSTTFSGLLVGSGTFTKQGTGILTLAGLSPNLTGTVTISGGTLQAGIAQSGTAGAFGNSAPVSIASGATLDLNGFNNTIGNLSGTGSITLGTATLTVSGSGAYAGVISGTGGITKQASGLLNLSGLNTYLGATTVSSGTLQAGTAGAFGNNSPVTISSGAVLDLNGFNNTVGNLSGTGSITTGTATLTISGTGSYAGVISGTGGVVKQASGTLTLSGTNTFQGGVTLSGGILSISSDSNLGSTTGTVIGNGGTLLTSSGVTFSSSRPFALSPGTTTSFDMGGNTGTISGTVSGSGAFSKINPGTLVLSQANTYTGNTLVNGGTLQAAVVGAFGNSSSVTISSGAVLDLNNFSNTIGNLSGTGSITLGTATLTVSGTGSYAGVISGGGGIIKQASGILTLSGSNNYTGSTLVSVGTLQAGNTAAFGNNSTMTVSSGATLDLNSFSNTVGSLIGTGNTTLGTGTLTIAGTGTYAGIISGTGGVIKQAAGTLTLSGASTFQGGVNLSGGILSISSDSNLGAITGTVMGNGGTLYTSSGISFSPSRPFVLNSGTTTSFDTGGNSSTISGSVTGSGTLQKAGTGTLTFSGANNGFSGGIIITSGVVSIDTGGNTGTISGTVSGNGAFSKINSGILVLSQANTYTGNTLVNGGTLQAAAAGAFGNSSSVTIGSGATLDLNNFSNTIGNLSGTGSITLGTATLTISGTGSYAGAISGTGGITKQASGILNLSGLNSYIGTTAINNGILQAGSTGAFGSSSSVTIADGATLDLNNFSNTIGTLSGTGSITLGAATLTVKGTGAYTGVISGTGGVIKQAAGTLTLSGANTFQGGITLTDGIVSISSDGNLGANTGTVLGDGGTLYTSSGVSFSANRPFVLGSGKTTSFDTGDNTTILSGTVSGTGSLSKINPGTLVLSHTNTYTGNTLINGGTLQAGATDALGNNSPVTVASGAVLDLNGFNNTIGNLAGAGTISLGGGNLTISGGSGSFSGAISGAGNVTITSPDIFELTGLYNSTTGTTSVTSGNFKMTGALSSSDISIASAATLMGTGTLTVANGGTLTIQGTLSPGASIGTIHTNGNFTFASGSIWYNEINTSGSSDKLTVNNGILTIGNGVTLVIVPENDGVYTPGVQYEIVTLTGTAVITPAEPTFNIQAPALFETEITSGTQGISLFAKSQPFTTYVNTGNPGQVAAAVDTLSETNTSPSDVISQDLLYLSPAGMTYAFNQMHPAIYKSSAIVQENTVISVQGSLTNRLNEFLDTGDIPCVYPTKAWHLWITGLGDYLSQGTTSFQSNTEYGYHTKTGGATGGIDYQPRKGWLLGVLGGYTHTSIHWNHTKDLHFDNFLELSFPTSWGKRFAIQTINTDYAGIYLSRLGAKAYANLSTIGSWGTYDGTRNIIFPGVNESAYNTHHGKQLLSRLNIGLKLTKKGITFRPFDVLNWIVQHEDGYTETGSETYDLTVRKSRTALLRNELGLIFSSSTCRPKMRLTGDLKLSWVREIRYGSQLTAKFAGTTVPFTVVGYFPERSLLSYGASLTGEALQGQLTYSVYYDGEMGRRYSNQAFGLQCAVAF